MSDWQVCKLGDLSTKIGSGSTPRGGSNSYKIEGISLIRSQNVLDLQFTLNGLAFIDDIQAAVLKNVTLKPNDILLNITGDSVARVCKVPNDILPARVNQHVAIIRTDINKLLPNFLLYNLIAQKEELLSQSEIGARRRAITKGMIEEFQITLPSLSEQKAIALVLSSLDDKIELLHRQNKTLEAMAETLFRQWFVEEVQENWEVGCLGDVATFHNGKKRPDEVTNGIYPVYGGNGILGYSDKFNYEYITIVIGRVGAYCGSLYIEHQPVWITDNALVAKPIDKEHSSYLFFLLTSLHLNNMAEGSSHPLLTQTLLKSVQISLVPKDLIATFVFQADIWLNKISENIKQIHMLEKLRDKILPKLMSGEVRMEL